MVLREAMVIRDGAGTDFEHFVDEYGDRLLHTAYGLCGDWQHAEDLAQQALASVAGRWEQIVDNPVGYAYRCLARANIDRWRRFRGRREVPASPATLESMQVRAEQPGTTGVDDRLTVAAVLQQLAPRQRAIVVLRFLQDLPEAEVAAALGISVGAVKSGASRALARLRAMHAFEENS